MSGSAAARNHYHTLGVSRQATQAEIKQAYRRLVKQHHPDRSQTEGDRIRQINAAYEVLGQPEARQHYDQRLHQQASPRPCRASSGPRSPTVTDEVKAQKHWIQQVYTPLNRTLSRLLSSLKPQLNALSADPFDPELMEAFESYLDDCDRKLARAQQVFRQSPNPSTMAGVASRLYHVLNHIEDALEELRYFTLNFDMRHIHTGQELFRRAKGLRSEAMETFRETRMVT